ncbi:hypothetical protein Tco_0001096 [Tanacetum coccineum]
MESVKKSIDERAKHKREYDSWVNERQIQTTEGKDTSSRSGNDAHADDADIRPIYDEEPMAENTEQCHDTCTLPANVNDNQTTELTNQSLEFENICLKKTVAQFQKDFLRMEAHCVNLELKYQNQALKEGQHGQFLKVTSNEAKVKHDIDVIETINIELEHKVAKLLKENETLKRHYKEMFDSIKTTRAKNIEHTTSLIANNDKFKAQLQEKGFAIAALKNELRKLTGNSVNTKFAKSSILGKPALQPRRNQSVVRQPTAFKSERPSLSKQRFASQVDVNNDLSKPVTTHYLPKERESAVAKPHHMIAPGSSRYSSNDMVHNHYLEEAKKKTQESSRNSEPSVMPSARSQSTTVTNGSKPKPRINNQKSRNWPASKSSCVTTKTVPIAEHSRNSRSFSDSKHFVCSTCQKCVFNANHDSCVTKFLNEVNLRAKVPSHKTTTRYKPVEQTSVAKKPERQIPIGHRFSIKKTSVVHEKTITPRSCLRWKPTGKIFKTVGLKWIPTGKIFTSSTTKVDSEPTNGSNDDITNKYECEQTLDVSAGTLNLSAGTSFNPKKEGLRVCSELGIHDHSNEQSSSKLVPKVVPPADKTATSRQELELLFHHHITMLRSYALSWKPCQGDSLNLPDHSHIRPLALLTNCFILGSHKERSALMPFILVKSDTVPLAHAANYKDILYASMIQEFMKSFKGIKDKDLRTNFVYMIFLKDINTKGSNNKTIILGRPFLANIRAEINVSTKEVSLGIEEDRVKIKMSKQECNFTTTVSEHLNERPTSQDELSYRAGEIPDKKLKHYWKSINNDDRIGIEWEGLSCTNWVRARYGKVNDITKERILQKIWDNKLGGQTHEKTITEEQEDPEKCGESKTRAIIRAMINKLPEEWFSEVRRIELVYSVSYPLLLRRKPFPGDKELAGRQR